MKKLYNRLVATVALFALAFGLGGCAHVQMVSATTSTGDTFEYCLQVSSVLGTDTLFCGGLSAVQAEQAKETKAHPDSTYTIVPAKAVQK